MDGIDDICDGEVVINQQDSQNDDEQESDLLNKGQISDETVAGTNEPTSLGNVLGTNTGPTETDSGNSTLLGTGQPAIITALAGITISLTTLLFARIRNK